MLTHSQTTNRNRCFTAAFSIAALAFGTHALAQTSSVPSDYQDLYSQLSSQMGSLSQTVAATPSSGAQPVTFAAQLLSATSENGTSMLQSGYSQRVLTEIHEQQALGVKAITVHINFPALFAPAYSDQTQYQGMLAFYEQVASEVHGAGMQLIVESQVAKADATMVNYAKSLSWTNYQAGRAQTCATIAQYIRPEYMTVITEPDTEAATSGQTQANTVNGSVSLLQTILNAVHQTGSSVSLGAGTGTWQSSFTAFLNAYAGQAVQFLDVHIYPINRTYFQNAMTAADIAHSAGKQITMSEGWLSKIRDSELSTQMNSSAIAARNAYSFWAPLDSQFLQLLATMAEKKQFTFVSPFWTAYFFAYMPYSSTAPSQSAVMQNATTAMNKPVFTSTALAWENAILYSADKSAPNVPAPPAFQKAQSSMHLSWAASSDNVGVAGYGIYKNGSLLATTTMTTYNDTAVTPGTSSSYALVAFDAAGNVSPRSSVAQAPKQ